MVSILEIMKKKILNWIYGICRKILATEKRPVYVFYETKKVELLEVAYILNDHAILESNLPLKKITIEENINKILVEVEKRILLQETRHYDGMSTIYSASIYVVSPPNNKSNGTNK